MTSATSVLIAVTALLPAVAAAAIRVRRPSTPQAAQLVTAATGIATMAAIGLLAAAGFDDDGRLATAGIPDSIHLGLDRLTAMLLVAVMGTATVVASFTSRSVDDTTRATMAFASLGVLASGSALVAIPGGPLPLAAGWIGSSWALVSLTRGWSDHAAAQRSTSRLARTMAFGDLALVSALVVAVAAVDAGVSDPGSISALALADAEVLGLDAATVVALLLIAAGAARTALFPFHRWLVGTLHAPTPVSALVHAGFVSGAGLLLIRFGPSFVDAPVATVAAFAIAVVTLVIGLAASATRSDAKGALAWSTVAQMAFMVAQVAAGAFAAAVFHIIGHGMYKAAMFLGVGDTVSSGLRSKRRPAPAHQLSPMARNGAAAGAATVAVALAWQVAAPSVNPAGEVLLAGFAWLTVASMVRGWLAAPLWSPLPSIATGVAGASVVTLGYFAAVGAVKEFLDPVVPDAEVSTAVGPWVVGATLAAVVVAMAAARLHPRLEPVARVHAALLADADPRELPVPTSAPQRVHTPDATASVSDVRGSQLRADVARAGSIIAPQWPLSSFVAVNPLGGVEHAGFGEAAQQARHWLRGRTHQTLERFRSDHQAGLTTRADLERAVFAATPDLVAGPPVDDGGRPIDRIDVITADLLHSPEAPPAALPRTALERAFGTDAGDRTGIDDLVGSWIAGWLAPSAWPLAGSDDSLVAVAKRSIDAWGRGRLSASARAWVASQPDDPASVLDSALELTEVDETDQRDEIRGLLATLPGWAGLAKWRTDWAAADTSLPPLSLLDVAAVRAMADAAVLLSTGAIGSHSAAPVPDDGGREAFETRVTAVARALVLETDDARAQVRDILRELPAADRGEIWLTAQEMRFDEELLAQLADAPTDAGSGAPPLQQSPDAQLVFCIDVRSEGYRRNLEALGHDQTIGFAGFFGVPMQVQELGWDQAEARCPVLVQPSAVATERPRVDGIEQAARRVRRSRKAGAVQAAHKQTKHDAGASFVAAEALGWMHGPLAAGRTLLPSRWFAKPVTPSTDTRVVIDHADVAFEQRLFFAESALTTMGLTHGFAPLVVLCGHTSETTNNPHATALECGACAGASGAANARAVAALLNVAEIRDGLAGRGIVIPETTWFVPGIHETVSDEVTLLDVDDVPASHHQGVAALRERLALAGARTAVSRAAALPGDADQVRHRGADWAQVRPEWGLAGNAAFIVGPRAITAEVDLGGRAFLHSYDAADDPDGAVLEAIMTAPLVVGHWICSQYYFSTVDDDAFGAGTKLLHNPIGTIGVVSGPGGDLRVGLPTQSTHVGDHPHHRPTRLLAVIDAHPDTIDQIVRRNPILATLVSGSWLRIAGRTRPGQPWSTRRTDGAWVTTPELSHANPELESV